MSAATGGVLWLRSYGGTGGAGRVEALAVGRGDDSLTVVGSFSGLLQLPGGPLQSDGAASDVFVLRADAASGEPVWAQRFGAC